jgi:NAD(P)H-nitrite reductase large subunit
MFDKDILEKGAVLQRDKETFAIVPHIPGGIILDSNYLRKIADVADKYGAQALKLTSAQRIAIVGIAEADIEKAWLDLGMDKGNAIGLCVRSIKICPGTTYCKRAQQDSVALGLELDKKYHGMQLPSKFKMGVSGCPNSCAENAVKDIGIQGTVKGWNVMIGGNAGVKPRLADLIAKELTSDEALALTDKAIKVYEANANKFERMSRMIERIGIEEFKTLLAAL